MVGGHTLADAGGIERFSDGQYLTILVGQRNQSGPAASISVVAPGVDVSLHIDQVLAGDVVWDRGLLTKGYGICHGTSGNAYAFLNLFHVTNDQKWLHRAIKVSF